MNGKKCEFEVDSGARRSEKVWKRLGQPTLQLPTLRYIFATGKPIPVIGTFQAKTLHLLKSSTSHSVSQH